MHRSLSAGTDLETRCLPPDREWFWCELELIAAQAAPFDHPALAGRREEDVRRLGAQAVAECVEAVAASAHRTIGTYLVTVWLGEYTRPRAAAGTVLQALEGAIDRALADEDPYALLAAARSAVRSFADVLDDLAPLPFPTNFPEFLE